MNRNAYDVLGVDKNADAPTIRKAYRKKARAAHPDAATGSEDAFKELNRAHLLLTEHRAEYDQFGDAADSPQSLRQKSEQCLAAMAVSCASDPMVDLERDDMRQKMRDCIANNRRGLEAQVATVQKAAAKLRMAAKRWRRKDGQQSTLATALEATAAQQDNAIKAAQFEVAKCAEMLVILDEQEYDAPPATNPWGYALSPYPQRKSAIFGQ